MQRRTNKNTDVSQQLQATVVIQPLDKPVRRSARIQKRALDGKLVSARTQLAGDGDISQHTSAEFVREQPKTMCGE